MHLPGKESLVANVISIDIGIECCDKPGPDSVAHTLRSPWSFSATLVMVGTDTVIAEMEQNLDNNITIT